MPNVLRLDDKGDDVRLLQTRLSAAGFRPGPVDGIFGHATHAAVLGLQYSSGLLVDGIVGPKTWKALGVGDGAGFDIAEQISVAIVAEIFPYTRLDAIAANLAHIQQALTTYELLDKPMVMVALATIRAETETFEPISELPSRYNSSPGGHLFDLYDHRRDLGNQGAPDGERFRGRGFVQLTGRANYAAVGRYIGLGDGLVRSPERCNEPAIAADILAAFLAMRRVAIKRAMLAGEWRQVRRLVNGGSHGLERFMDAMRIADRLFDDHVWPIAGLRLPSNSAAGF